MSDQLMMNGESTGANPSTSTNVDITDMKYILVTGGVISGVGKGIISSSIGVILKAYGYRVNAIKIDPYINVDAGTFSPNEHGEVFVLDDGGEVDLDLGNYERFLGIRLTKDNNITTGKIYKQVIDRERRGDYLGKTVQVIPHITDAIMEWVEKVSRIAVDRSGKQPHVCIIELGGTVGDIEGMPFAEAFRQFQCRAHRSNLMTVHVSLVIEPKSTGEQKTKPTQNSVRDLRTSGLSPDMVVCRSETPLATGVKAKISNFCMVELDQVFGIHDVTNIYHVPLLLHDLGALEMIKARLQMDTIAPECLSEAPGIDKWRQLAQSCDVTRGNVKIALVGKYVQLEDAYASVNKALKHAAMHCGYKLTINFVNSEYLEESQRVRNPSRYHEAWGRVTSCNGLLVPGGFGDRGIEGMIAACKWAREQNIPFLGVCLGMQCAVIEFARNVCHMTDANSTEFNQTIPFDQQVVINMPEHAPGADRGMGGTMRLGRRTTVFLSERSKLYNLYGCNNAIEERHRHRYEVNPRIVPTLTENGLVFVGMGVDEGSTDDVIIPNGVDNDIDEVVNRTESSNALIKIANHKYNNNSDADLLEKIRRLCLRNDTSIDGDRTTAVRMEIVELKDHPYYVGVQFHPEFLSNPLKPSAPFFGLLLAATNQLDAYLSGQQLASTQSTIFNGELYRSTAPIDITKHKQQYKSNNNGFNHDDDESMFSRTI